MENHAITIDNRRKLSITEVTDIDNFDEEEICANLTEGGLLIKGRDLHIQKLDLAEGKVVISGEVLSLTYTQVKSKTPQKWLKKIFK